MTSCPLKFQETLMAVDLELLSLLDASSQTALCTLLPALRERGQQRYLDAVKAGNPVASKLQTIYEQAFGLDKYCLLLSLPDPEIHATVQEDPDKRDCSQKITVDSHAATRNAPSTAAARTKAAQAAEARARKAAGKGVGDPEVESNRARTEEQLKRGTADSWIV